MPVLTTNEATRPDVGRSGAVPGNRLGGIELRLAWGLLQEHLKRNAVWRMLADWKKAYAAHLNAKIAFQCEMVELGGRHRELSAWHSAYPRSSVRNSPLVSPASLIKALSNPRPNSLCLGTETLPLDG